MSNREPLTVWEKEEIVAAKVAGKTLSEIAELVGCSVSCSRKWWRRGRDYGLVGLAKKRRGRGKSGKLSHFDQFIARQALALKQSHPKWGAARVLLEMAADPQLEELPLPAARTLASYFQAACPELLRRKKKKKVQAQATSAQGVHEVWQVDHQEGIRLDNGEAVTICNIRDPYAAAILMSQAIEVTTEKYWRKVTFEEVRCVLRDAFTQWQTMPQGVRTDNEPGLGGSPKADFPSLLTLWLAGLGIQHQRIRPGCPTDQAEVERCHQTINGFAVHPAALTNRETLQASLDKERAIHNDRFPSRAHGCHGLPPATAHPQLHSRPRPYAPEWEWNLFNLQLVADHLATYSFERKVSVSGQLSLGGNSYYVGVKHEGLLVRIHFEAQAHLWLFTDTQSGGELGYKPPLHFSVEFFTGLQPPTEPVQTAIQLSLPGFL